MGQEVLRAELKDTDLVGWYRNPTGTSAALRVPYEGEGRDRPMYPDFVFFHRTDIGIRPSIVDPHGYHLADALSKMRGLAAYAGRHSDLFARIESVLQEPDGTLLAVDWKSELARAAVSGVGGVDVLEFFHEHGGRYA
jgi:type III restriction enzyme